jgi:acyl-CoA hydrolase
VSDAPRPEPPVTRFTHLVMPADTNHLGTLYGGTLMGWMDSAAGIAGVRRAGTRTVVTAMVDELTFRVAIREGELVELVAEVESVGRTSMRIRVEAHREDPVTHTRELCTAGVFTMVALDDDGKPTPVRDL